MRKAYQISQGARVRRLQVPFLRTTAAVLKRTPHVQDGGKMRVAIQRTDDRTGARGSFGFRTGRNTVHGVRFYSLTPVFDSLVQLYEYMKENHITVDDSPADTGIISL